MKSQVSVDELAAHIRQEILRLSGEANLSPPVADAPPADRTLLPLPPSLPPPPLDAMFLEGITAETGNLIARARLKLTVKWGIPKFLRPLFRNQGGYNEIVLKTLDLLGYLVCQLAAENERLREHAVRQETWMRDAAKASHALHTRLSLLEQQGARETPPPPAAQPEPPFA